MSRGATILCGTTAVPDGTLHALRIAWAMRRLVLFLGGGVSSQYGLPDWNRLLLGLLERRLARARGLAGCGETERRVLAAWLFSRLANDPLVIARSIKRDIGLRDHRGNAPAAEASFLREIRDVLYRDAADPRREPRPGSTLDSVGALLEHASSGRHVARVVTFNYDDLLERELTRRGVAHHTVFEAGGPRAPGLRIVHAHGYLPRRGRIPPHEVVLSEDDYHRAYRDDGHWSGRAVIESLQRHVVVCIGLSLRDPNLRRLLDAARESRRIPAHWQIQSRMIVREHELHHVTRELAQRLRGQNVGSKSVPRIANELAHRVAPVLRKAESLSRAASEALGVKTLWIEQYEDLPAVLDAIREG